MIVVEAEGAKGTRLCEVILLPEQPSMPQPEAVVDVAFECESALRPSARMYPWRKTRSSPTGRTSLTIDLVRSPRQLRTPP